ncbi:MAG: hypothetical protein E7557_07555 [Ruminococcaceae bacterium]|nr:hypothetical protein [Oscillospiraceae bacterium]
MEKFIVATENSWWIIIALVTIFILFAVFVEIFSRKNFKGKYLEFIPISFMIGCGIVALIFSLMLVWWLALPICIGWIFFTRMEEKADILQYFRKKGETVEDYKPYQSNLFAMCSSAFMSYMVGVIVQFYFEL